MSARLTPEEWRQLSPLIDALLETPAEQRAERIAELSGGDVRRREELERLVSEFDQNFALFDRPAAERFAALVADDAMRFPEGLADRYRPGREIGRGGMAVVYLARDLKHSRDVAVKVVRPVMASALGGNRFLREIEIVAGLRHPHIVPLYDSGESDGFLYYVMPYEPGPSLRARLAREGALPLNDAIVILRDVCEALAHAHQQGIVHRDIKPDNVLLVGRHALVTDFGVARAASEARASPAVTTAGVAVGTPAYMAPEQIAADPRVDHRADIYAVGVLAYELLTGRPPFVADSPQDVLSAHLVTPPEPVARHRPHVPTALAEVVMKCLEKRVDERWQSAEELVSRLESLIAPSGGEAAPDTDIVTPRVTSRPAQLSVSFNRRSLLLGMIAAAAVVLAMAASWLRNRASASVRLDPGKLVVVPFRVTGVDSSWAEGVVDLLSARLTGEGGPVAVDARTTINAWHRVTKGRVGTASDARKVARSLGAAQALLGSINSAGSRVTVTASLIPVESDAVGSTATVGGQLDSLTGLLDAVAVRIAARQAGVAEHALDALASYSFPALRAYLLGRTQYRRGHSQEAIQHFSRALQIDSTFALAALDLVIATGRLLALDCPDPRECFTVYFPPGQFAAHPEGEDIRNRQALEIAWRNRAKLTARDRPLLEAIAGEPPLTASSARRLLGALLRAASAAPDRAETQYLIGLLLLNQGTTLGLNASSERAIAAFNQALALDSGYLAPLGGLVEAAALERDAVRLRRMGALYLSRDSIGPAADYIRWRVAAGIGDRRTLAMLRARFDSLDTSTLRQIAQASQTGGLALEDAERAVSLIVRRSADQLERKAALMYAHWLALNRGRPQEAVRLMRLQREVEPTDNQFLFHGSLAALLWDGDSAVGRSIAEIRSSLVARDTLAPPARQSRELSRTIAQQGLWDLFHGDTARANAAIRWLRRHRPLGADLVEAVIAARERRPQAPAILARLDSIALEGCCKAELVRWVNLVIARAYEAQGKSVDALDAIRRGVWRYPPQLLTTYLREEGRLAARLGDSAGAIRAYRHYLALRSDPEPSLRAEVNRIRDELARLENAPPSRN